MRFILQEDVYEELPPDWDEKVSKANAAVESAVEKARKRADAAGKSPDEVKDECLRARHKAIDAKGAVWRAAAAALKAASFRKCWYCECRQERSDNPVDHFRPKNRIVEAPEHPGYYWLAFEWKNFRYSCTYCNSYRKDLEGRTDGGKQDHFPIIEPPPYALSHVDPREHPELLDPTNEADTKLLTFLANGFPHCATKDDAAIRRVETSIKLYHLRHGPLVRKRKILAADIDEHVQRGEDARASGDEETYRYHKKEIIKKVRAKSELSSAARVFLQQHRSRDWVDELIGRDL